MDSTDAKSCVKAGNKAKQLIEAYYNVNLSEKTRRRDIVHFRFLYYYLAYNHSSGGYSLDALGQTLGFDHATVLYGIKQYKNLYEFDKRFRETVDPFLETIMDKLKEPNLETTIQLKKQVKFIKERIIKIEKQLEEIL